MCENGRFFGITRYTFVHYFAASSPYLAKAFSRHPLTLLWHFWQHLHSVPAMSSSSPSCQVNRTHIRLFRQNLLRMWGRNKPCSCRICQVIIDNSNSIQATFSMMGFFFYLPHDHKFSLGIFLCKDCALSRFLSLSLLFSRKKSAASNLVFTRARKQFTTLGYVPGEPLITVITILG